MSWTVRAARAGCTRGARARAWLLDALEAREGVYGLRAGTKVLFFDGQLPPPDLSSPTPYPPSVVDVYDTATGAWSHVTLDEPVGGVKVVGDKVVIPPFSGGFGVISDMA